MIPEKTLEIIWKYAKEYSCEMAPDLKWDVYKDFTAGAKRGYELAMGDRWIEIKAGCEMPDYDNPVLWLCENGNMHVEMLDKDGNPWLFKDEDPDDVWGKLGTKATHWQPLPSPPKPKP